jgi:hypothetical protein
MWQARGPTSAYRRITGQLFATPSSVKNASNPCVCAALASLLLRIIVFTAVTARAAATTPPPTAAPATGVTWSGAAGGGTLPTNACFALFPASPSVP